MKEKLIYLTFLTIFINSYKRFLFPFSSVNGVFNIYLTPRVYLTDLLLLAISGVTIFQLIKYYLYSRGQRFLTNHRPFLFLALISFCFASFLSAVISKNPALSYYSHIRLLAYTLLFISVSTTINSLRKFHTLVWAVSGSVLVSSVFVFMQWTFQRYFLGFFPLGEPSFASSLANSPLVNYFGELKLRSFATFPHPNILGGFLSIITIWLLDLFLLQFKKFHYGLKPLYLFVVLSLGVISLYLSFSQGAWGAFLVGAVLYLTMTVPFNKPKGRLNSETPGLTDLINATPSNRFRLTIIFLTFLGLIIALYAIYSLPLDSFTTRRRDLIAASVDLFKSSPITGVGLGNFVRFSSYYWKEPVHNIYLLILSETGLLGLVSFVLLVLFCLKSAFRKIFRSPVLFASVIQVVFLGFFDHYFLTSQAGGLLFWTVLGLSVSRDYD